MGTGAYVSDGVLVRLTGEDKFKGTWPQGNAAPDEWTLGSSFGVFDAWIVVDLPAVQGQATLETDGRVITGLSPRWKPFWPIKEACSSHL